MSNNIAVKYTTIVLSTLFAFANFIACGAQRYQVSLEEDHDPSQVSEASKNPDSALFGIHSVSGWSELPIRFKVSSGMDQEQLKGLACAMGVWEKAVGKKLFQFEGKDSKVGDSFDDLYSSLSDSTNGHYFDLNWQKTGKSELVLATTIWDNQLHDRQVISNADIRYNEEHYLIGDSYAITLPENESREVCDMCTLAIHELGHLLGLSHVPEEHDPHSIMNPSIYIGEGLANRIISPGDIERIQKIYGCEGEACDADDFIEGVHPQVGHDHKQSEVVQHSYESSSEEGH